MALFFNKTVLENDQIVNDFLDTKVFLNRVHIRETKKGIIDPYLYNIESASMRVYLLSLIMLSSRKGYIRTSSDELLLVLYGGNTFNSRNTHNLLNGKIYSSYIEAMQNLITQGYISIVDGEFNPNKVKQEFILKVNKDKTRLNFDKGDKGVVITLKEFQSIMTIKDVSPTKKLKLLYTFLYIKSYAFTYKSNGRNIVYAKCIYDKIKAELGISIDTIRSYIAILSGNTAPIVKCRLSPFVISDYKCDDKFFSSPNLFMFRYDSYYKGMEEDVKSIETKQINDYLELMCSERKKKNV